jgi:hypothetical protein
MLCSPSGFKLETMADLIRGGLATVRVEVVMDPRLKDRDCSRPDHGRGRPGDEGVPSKVILAVAGDFAFAACYRLNAISLVADTLNPAAAFFIAAASSDASTSPSQMALLARRSSLSAYVVPGFLAVPVVSGGRHLRPIQGGPLRLVASANHPPAGVMVTVPCTALDKPDDVSAGRRASIERRSADEIVDCCYCRSDLNRGLRARAKPP